MSREVEIHIHDEAGRGLDGAKVSIDLGTGTPLVVEDARSSITLTLDSDGTQTPTVEVTWEGETTTVSIGADVSRVGVEFETAGPIDDPVPDDVSRELMIVHAGSTQRSVESIPESETTTIGPDPSATSPAQVLVCTANAWHSNRLLRLDTEMKKIQEALQNSNQRDCYALTLSPQVTFSDVIRKVEDREPMFLHFSGHSDNWNRLVLEGENGTPKLVSPALLAELLEGLPNRPTLVTFATCYSWELAAAAAHHVPFAIGFRGRLSDARAPVFSSMLYDRLFSRPVLDVARAFRSAQLDFEGDIAPEVRQSKLFMHPRAKQARPPLVAPRSARTVQTRTHAAPSHALASGLTGGIASRVDADTSAELATDTAALLANLLYRPDEARMTACRAGVEVPDIPAFQTSKLFWDTIVEAATNGRVAGGLVSLVDAALEDFEYNDELKRLRTKLGSQD